MILLLLSLLDLLFGVIDIDSIKHVKKKDRHKIYAYSMISNKSVRLMYNKRWKVVEW